MINRNNITTGALLVACLVTAGTAVADQAVALVNPGFDYTSVETSDVNPLNTYLFGLTDPEISMTVYNLYSGADDTLSGTAEFLGWAASSAGPFNFDASYYDTAPTGPGSFLNAGGSLIQTVDAALNANKSYQLGVDIFVRSDFGFTPLLSNLDFKIIDGAGNDVFGMATMSDFANGTAHVTFTTDYTSAVNVGDLTVMISNYAGQITVDNITLDELDVKPADLDPRLIINRETGQMTFKNMTASDITMLSYSVTSASGTLNSDAWNTISGNHDTDGDASLSGDAWTRFTQPGGRSDLSEMSLTGEGSIAIDQSYDLGQAWIKHTNEDVSMQILDENGELIDAIVIFEGNDGLGYESGDLNFDGNFDASDWVIFRDAYHADLSGMSIAESYAKGDLNGDGENNTTDFVSFKDLYNVANGEGAFTTMVASIPEPTALTMIFTMGGLLLTRKQS